MPASSLLALLDDIAGVLDDVAVLAKLAAKKTAGVLGDDLAVNAQQVHGVSADRELPVVWAVAKGSLVNKAILVPAALLISAFAPVLVTPLLMAGGAFLCFEGAEKLAHRLLHAAKEEDLHQERLAHALADPAVDLVAVEADKIKGAIRTDFILSAEIITITLGTVAAQSLPIQLGVMVGVALLMTLGVYGFVAAIVKLDDLGLWLGRQRGSLLPAAGRGILALAPWLMKALSVLGTAAMFLVGGGILVHGLPAFGHALDQTLGELAGPLQPVLSPLAQALVGVVAGLLVLAVVAVVQRLRGVRSEAAPS